LIGPRQENVLHFIAPPKKKFFAIIQKIAWKLVKWRCSDDRIRDGVFLSTTGFQQLTGGT